MSQVDRRTVLKAGAAVALSGPFAGFFARQALASPPSATAGPALVDVPDLRDGVVRLRLPAGFSYRSFQYTGEVLGDGTVIPGRHDGMAGFAGPNGNTRLVRNHEILGPGTPFATTITPYDSAAIGGTTNVLVSGDGTVIDSWASLTGSQGNCAGGWMPWGNWVTCQETINGPDVFDDFTRGSAPPETYVKNAQLHQKHGYLFEVPANGVSDAVPVKATGRFSHEAIAYSPGENAFYLTEDDFAFPSGFYRYVPPQWPGQTRRLRDGGRLFALAIPGSPEARLEAATTVGQRFPARWVPIDDPDPTFPMDTSGPTPVPTVTNDEAIHAVAEQGWVQGAAYFARLEGAKFDSTSSTVYFTSTQGGGAQAPWVRGDPGLTVSGFGSGFGQIWAYHTLTRELELVYVSPGPDVLDFPDNVTTSRNGTLVVCEDGVNGNYLRGLTKTGVLFNIAQNMIPKGTDIGGDEFAGSTFSPDYRTLFVNIQASTGLSIAIWGNWSGLGA